MREVEKRIFGDILVRECACIAELFACKHKFEIFHSHVIHRLELLLNMKDGESGVHIFLEDLTVGCFDINQHVVSNEIVHDEVMVVFDTEMVECLFWMHRFGSNRLDGYILTRGQFQNRASR